MKARELLAVLMREPLSYQVVRQRGSHRRLKAQGRPSITFAFHDGATIAPGIVGKILCRDVGLGEGRGPEATVKLVMTVRVLYHQEPDGSWAESPDIDGWSVAGESYEEVRRLAEDGVSFALASAAEDRGEAFEEDAFASVSIEHYVPAPA